MGYKHSPANAKMSAFMNKMNNTGKSPARQFDSKTQAKESLTSQSKEKTAETFNPEDYRTVDFGNDFSIKVGKDNKMSDNRILANKYKVGVEQYLQGKETGDEQLMSEGSTLMNKTGQILHAKGLSTELADDGTPKAIKQLNTGNWYSGHGSKPNVQDRTGN
tara:strand:+ start:677 stop:1162 length:486 start_codon:yes stop_codon:yes gene_type:complete